MNTDREETLRQIFQVFDMFGFDIGSDIRFGSLQHLFGAATSSSEADSAINHMLENGWLVEHIGPEVRPGGYTLTQAGLAAKRELLGDR